MFESVYRQTEQKPRQYLGQPWHRRDTSRDFPVNALVGPNPLDVGTVQLEDAKLRRQVVIRRTKQVPIDLVEPPATGGTVLDVATVPTPIRRPVVTRRRVAPLFTPSLHPAQGAPFSDPMYAAPPPRVRRLAFGRKLLEFTPSIFEVESLPVFHDAFYRFREPPDRLYKPPRFRVIGQDYAPSVHGTTTTVTTEADAALLPVFYHGWDRPPRFRPPEASFVAVLVPFVAPTVGGPYAVVIGEVFQPGITAGEIFQPGAAVREVFQPGVVAGESSPT